MSNTLLDVAPAIYRNRNIEPKSYYGGCVKQDILSTLHPLLKRQGYYLSYDGCYKRMAIAVGLDTPWHHVKHLKTKKCGLDHGVKFEGFGYVPPRCLECWKVVVYPRTLKELFALLDIQSDLGKPAKCGIDIRYYSSTLYDGFFYNNSLDEGRVRYQEVRKAVDEHIGKDVRVILKRGCTEYEMVLGPSVGWAMTNRQREIDEQIEQIVDTYTPNAEGQTSECLAQVHTHWIEWAWKFQDPTVKEYLGELPLYPPAVTYHEGDISQIRGDIMRARAKVKYNIEPEVTDAVHAALRGFEMTKKVGLGKMGAIIGYDDINPLYVGEGVEIG